MNDMSDLPYAVFSKDGTSKLWVRFSIKGEGLLCSTVQLSAVDG